MRIHIRFYVDEAEESEGGAKPERRSGADGRTLAQGRKKFRPARGAAPPGSRTSPAEPNRDR